MRIVAWNIRAGGGRRAQAIAAQILRWQADVVALSEFRGTPPSVDLAAALREGALAAQLHTINEQTPSRNSLLIASRWPLERVVVDVAPQNAERWLCARVLAPISFTVVAVHVPNRASGHKWPFHDATLRVVRAWNDGPAVLVGDTNTGRIGIDEARTGAGFIEREDTWMRNIEDAGWRDAFRHLSGRRRSWTWYSPNAQTGYRLDQAFVTAALLARLQSARHVWGRARARDRRDALSDHAALVVDFDRAA